MLKFKDIQSKKNEELTKILKDKQDELKDFRFGSTGAKSKNVKLGSVIRKDIARILTFINASKNK